MIHRRHAPDPSERLQAVLSLPEAASSQRPLLDAVADVSLDVARAALRRLVRIAGPTEVAALRARMLELDIGVVGDVAAALRELSDPEAATVAAASLRADSSFTRHKAAVALRELRDPAARVALLRALDDSETPVRRVALEALSELSAEPETITACRRLLGDVDSSVRSAAVRAIARLDTDAASILRPLLYDREPRVRAQLGSAAPVLDTETLRVLLGDADADVRSATLAALSEHPCRELMPTLIATLADVNWHVRRAACDAVAATGGAGASAALVRALVDPHPNVRARALVALERMAGGDLDRILERSLNDAPAPLRRTLIELLGRRGRTDVVVRFATDPAVEVRVALIHALAAAESRAGRDALRYLSDDDELAVRHAASLILEAGDERRG